MNADRRTLLKSSLLLAASGTVLAACGQGGNETSGGRVRAEGGDGSVDLDALLQATDLGDMTLGDPDAPVVLVEYASMTCPHCANFHMNALPAIKSDYIDAGQVYYVYREFPLDARARAAAMLARCSSEDLFHDVVNVLFERQGEWARAQNPAESLFGIVAQAGFSEDSFNACLTNRDLETAIVEIAERGANEFEVSATPTLFINGTRFSGAMSADQVREVIDPLL